jgi:hypothetical protein
MTIEMIFRLFHPSLLQAAFQSSLSLSGDIHPQHHKSKGHIGYGIFELET